MFWYMDLVIIITLHGELIENILILDDEKEIVLPKVEIREDEVLQYNDVKYKLKYERDVFNDGDNRAMYYYSLVPEETPITRLKLDKYIDEYFDDY